MSELIEKNDDRTTIRWKLLTGASALAVMSYVSSAGIARAEDADRPLIWVELGGELDMMHGLTSPFTAPFMTAITPAPGPYKGDIFNQAAPRFALSMDGAISFQPENSDWLFSASIRYGRSHTNRHAHHQTVLPLTYQGEFGNNERAPAYGSPFADIRAPIEEKHTILDFGAGKDVGLGLFGDDGTSTINIGVRFAQFASQASVHISGRPIVLQYASHFQLKFRGFPIFNEYILSGQADRRFEGVGPSLSWQASAAIAGNKEDGELMLDWGINGAELFGRQRAKTQHETSAYHEAAWILFGGAGYHKLYAHGPYHSTRSKRVSVPDIGGFAGISWRVPNVKISIGYKADFFFGTIDGGNDVAEDQDLTFHGLYASISVGLGSSDN